ncbi:MAG: hypothetical protein LQ341_003551, partial [Variospora aurantia]
EIRLFDTVDKGIVQDLAFCIRLHQLIARPVGEVQRQPPWQRGRVRFRRRMIVVALRAVGLCWRSAREEIVE